MSYQGDITAAIEANATLSGLIGNRVFADVAPSSATVPYVVFQTISGRGETTHDGVRNLGHPLIQFSAWAATKVQATAIADAINTLLDGNIIAGDSEATFQYSNDYGTHDAETNLFGEIKEYRASHLI
jgi:hypothetical protein